MFNRDIALGLTLYLVLQAERARKAAESERDEAGSRVSEINIHISALTNEKRRLEGDNTSLLADLEEARANLVCFHLIHFELVNFVMSKNGQ